MSYDLYMLAPEPGVDPMDQLERMEEGAGPPDPAAVARQRRLADAVRAADPRYDEHEFEFEGAPGIELSAEDGLQITFWLDHASITFPYWDGLDTSRLIADIDRAAKAIAAETGWQLYDPQLEKFIDPARDAHAVAEAFGVGVAQVQGMTAEPPDDRPSLWRRLFGRA